MEGLIQPFLQNINFSVVSANIKPDYTLAELHKYYSPYKVISVGSEKVAVVGYTSAETPFLSMPGKSAPICTLVPPNAHALFFQFVDEAASRSGSFHSNKTLFLYKASLNIGVFSYITRCLAL